MFKAVYNFEGKNALVTGVAQGIGKEIAIKLAKQNCNILATDVNKEDLDLTAKEIKKLGFDCHTRVANLANIKEAMDMAYYYSDLVENIDILVNVAGVAFEDYIIDFNEENWDQTINVNLKAPIFITKVIANKMKKRKKGSIINISSVAGSIGLEGLGAYCASKHGLNGITKVMALEWGRYNIRVNAVAPQVVLTEMGKKHWENSPKKKPMISKIPLGRFLTPDDVVDCVLFLASDSSSMISGAIIKIDGGTLAGLYFGK